MILALWGYAGSGKDTVAARLVDKHGWTRYAFADPMRKALYTLNPQITGGIRLRDLVDSKALGWEYIKRDDVYGPEVRGLLQRFGTEVGRVQWGEDFWVDRLHDEIFAKSDEPGNVVITDCRFPNEAQWVRDQGGRLWRVNRAGVTAVNRHQSERALEYHAFDGTIFNNGTIDDLNDSIDWLVTEGRLS